MSQGQNVTVDVLIGSNVTVDVVNLDVSSRHPFATINWFNDFLHQSKDRWKMAKQQVKAPPLYQ